MSICRVDHYQAILMKGQPNEPIVLSSLFAWIICACYKKFKSVYSNICHMLHVNTENFYFNYEINSAYAYDSFDNNVNNKLNRAEVIVKDLVVINENKIQ